jgi:hypothetical protein
MLKLTTQCRSIRGPYVVARTCLFLATLAGVGAAQYGKGTGSEWSKVVVEGKTTPDPEARDSQTHKPVTPAANRSIVRRLLRGDLDSQLKMIDGLRQRRLDEPAVLAALVECGDQILAGGALDTRVYLIVETLGTARELDFTRAALLRWLGSALDQPSQNPTDPWQMLAHGILVALRSHAHDEVQQRAVALLDSQDRQLKILAIDILGNNRYEPALTTLIGLLDSDEFRQDYALRYSLIEALSRYPQQQAEAALNNQLSQLSGQLRHLLEQHLETKRRASDRQRDTVVVETRALRPDADTDQPNIMQYSSGPSSTRRKARREEYRIPRFLGVPIYADRITFVIDFSGTMGHSTGRNSTRLSTAKAELRRAVLQLEPHRSFRVIGFETNVVPLSPTLVPATPENAADLFRRLDYLTIGAGTNLYGGLQAAINDPTQPELIILLSDGLPTRGELVRDDQILRAVGYSNLFRRITIDTIAVGRNSWLMEQLARQNRGSTRRIN